MRQRLGEKKVARLKASLHLPIVMVFVRGGTDHRQDLGLEDGSILYYWSKTGEMEQCPIRWR